MVNVSRQQAVETREAQGTDMQEVTANPSPNMIQGLKVPVYAGRIGASARQVYRMIEQGEVRAYRIGRALRVPSTEVERYISTHMEHAEVH